MIVSVALALVFSVQAQIPERAQGITPSDVEQQVRASLAAWNAGDLDRIVDTPGLSNNDGIGFGWRTKDPRVGESREYQLETIRPFFATVEYYRITDEEIHTAVDGDVGLAWGFFTEDFQVRGRAPEKIRVRFTTVFKREGGRLRQILFHRDAQSFDDQSNYIPALSALK
jgi:ketosteroid isomerase-like protein